jgi:hypothetical protein
MKKPLYYLLIFFLFSCKDPYNIHVKSSEQSVLVVDGALNTTGTTTILISHSVALDDTARIAQETNSDVTVEGNDNSLFRLQETSPGSYTYPQLPLQTGNQYRLHIKTFTGKEYFSEFIKVLKTPPIDSLNWIREEKGVTVYANTHDPENNTHYYRWEYDETWEIHSAYYASYKFDPASHEIIPMPYNENTYICWKYAHSMNIILASSAQLQSDVIFEHPLLTIPPFDEKLSIRYSIQASLYGLTKQAYDYLQLMKKNTESLGSIFDSQPSELTGNMYNLNDPKEKVIGFLTAGPVWQKRIFINNDQLTGWTFNLGCQSKEIANNPDTIKQLVPMIYLPYGAHSMGTGIIGYYVSSPRCVDCALRGGSREKPIYW